MLIGSVRFLRVKKAKAKVLQKVKLYFCLLSLWILNQKKIKFCTGQFKEENVENLDGLQTTNKKGQKCILWENTVRVAQDFQNEQTFLHICKNLCTLTGTLGKYIWKAEISSRNLLLRVCGEHGGNSIQGDKKHQLPITRHVISGQYKIYIQYIFLLISFHTGNNNCYN
jgi:hypothetical protein